MRQLRTLVPAALLVASAAYAHAERRPAQQFDLVNGGRDSVIAVAIAPAGDGRFQDIALGVPLQGGNTTATVDMPAGDCLRDVRVDFKDGRRLLYPGIDVCRYRRLQLRPTDGR